MNSSKKHSFYILQEGTAPSDLQKELTKDISLDGISFVIEKTEAGNRGLPAEVAVAYIAAGALLISTVLTLIGTFLIKRYELKHKEKGEVILKVKTEKSLIYAAVDNFPESVPAEIRSLPISEIEFIGISEA